jgi:four helix bundle protein
MMSYEKLDVYQCSIEFLGIATQLIDGLPKGYATLVDQLKRASISIPLNIGEGAGKASRADCRRYFASARGSAMECGAIMDVCQKLQIADPRLVSAGKPLLERVVAMLTRMVRD